MNLKFIYKRICFLLLYFMMTDSQAIAQDIHFSQFWMTPTLLNPAQAGAQEPMRVILNYKNQWSSVAQPYSTGNFSFDAKLGKKNKKAFSGLGLNVSQDKSGSPFIKTFQASLAYAAHVHINDKSTIGAGLYGGIIQRSTSYTSIQWMNQYDGMAYNGALPSGEPAVGASLMCFDAGAGINYEYRKSEKYMTGNDNRRFSMGASVFHVNQPSYSFYGTGEKLYLKMVGYANAEIGIANSNVSIVPGVVYSQQGTAGELLAGTMFQYQLTADSKYTGFVKASSLSLGAYYRGNDAVIATALFKISQYAIGVSYDVNISSLKTASTGRGGFEISLRFVNPNPFLYKGVSRL
jgi:type IX secretion system PorP/SprF family membrane protein